MKICLWIFTFQIILSASAANEKNCSKIYSQFIREAFDPKEDETVRKAIVRYLSAQGAEFISSLFNPIGTSVYKLSFYPILGPIRLASEIQQVVRHEGAQHVWKVPFRIVRRDGGVILAAATLVYLEGKVTITQVDFDRETSAFRSELGDGVYVVANLFQKRDALASVPEYEFQQKYAMFPNTHLIRANDLKDLLSKLTLIKNQYGPITGLAIETHGAPGSLQGIDLSQLNQLNPVNGLFSKNGKILLNSCSTGSGTIGENFARKLGLLLLDEGGTVYSSRLMIESDVYYAWPGANGIPEPIAKIIGWSESYLTSTIQPVHVLAIGVGVAQQISAHGSPIPPKQRIRETKIEPRK